jgi:hypothetical protein
MRGGSCRKRGLYCIFLFYCRRVLMKYTTAISAVFALCLLASAASAAQIATDKFDYAPEEIVHVSGSGFQASAPVAVTVTRPDGETGTVYGGTDAEGTFADIAYQLDGICGTYQVVATDGTNEATVIFTDSTCIWSQACSTSGQCTGAASGSKWYYDDDGTGSCSSNCYSAGTKHCKYQESECADQDSTDGVPNIGGVVRTSGAVCDEDSDCSQSIPQDACMDAPSCEQKCDGNCMCLFWCNWHHEGDEDALADDYYDYTPDCDSCSCDYTLTITKDDERCAPPAAPEFPLAAAAPVIAGAGLLTAYGVSRKK